MKMDRDTVVLILFIFHGIEVILLWFLWFNERLAFKRMRDNDARRMLMLEGVRKASEAEVDRLQKIAKDLWDRNARVAEAVAKKTEQTAAIVSKQLGNIATQLKENTELTAKVAETHDQVVEKLETLVTNASSDSGKV